MSGQPQETNKKNAGRFRPPNLLPKVKTPRTPSLKHSEIKDLKDKEAMDAKPKVSISEDKVLDKSSSSSSSSSDVDPSPIQKVKKRFENFQTLSHTF